MKNLTFVQNKKIRNKFDICKIFVFYWIALIIWQNVFDSQNRGTVNAIVKVFLLVYLTFSFFRVRTSVNRNAFIMLLLFVLSQMITFVLCDADNVSLGIIVQYVYPSLLLLLVHCVGHDLFVTKKQVDKMNGYILIVLVISILYILLFEPSQYTTAINAQNSGYGHELCSFFTSMHEYAVYLFYGVAVCINRIVDRTKGQLVYYILLVIFFATMIFTFSRTAIVACMAYIFVYSILNIQEKISKAVICSAIIFVIILSLKTSLYEYIFQVVWKSGEISSRDILTELAYNYLENGSVIEKIFGHGIAKTRAYFFATGEYGSIHNGYLQVLAYYGGVGLVFMLSYMLTQLRDIAKLFKIDKNVALSSLCMLIFCILAMIPQTFIVFTSSIDCYFITVMLLVIPKYQRNSVLVGQYY